MFCSQNASVFVSQFDLFAFSHGEPPPEFVTARRVLDVSSFSKQVPALFSFFPFDQISDPWVMRVLINASSIEKTLLADNRDAGSNALRELMSRTGGGGNAWTNDLYTVREQRYVITAP